MLRVKHIKTEYESQRSAYRSVSGRHVLVIEADVSEDIKRSVFHDADALRRCGNELTAYMRHNYKQMTQTKRYRKLRELYGQYKEAGDTKACKDIGRQMNEMQKQFDVTWDACRKKMAEIRHKYNIGSIFALTRAEDIWSGIKKVLYSEGKKMHLKKRGDLPILRAKQIDRGISIFVKDDRLYFKYNGISFTYKGEDRFINDETDAVLEYLKSPEAADRVAIAEYINNGRITSTYRPCYVSLSCEVIRGKLRVYIHITIEGNAKNKYNKDGTPRHTYGAGLIGADVGTQTFGYVSDDEAGLKNLAERGVSVAETESKIASLQRAMERSRRGMNPEYYNKDGTVKKGKKNWRYSNKYCKLKYKYHELCRKAAINRKLAINEDINHLRSLGDTFITEKQSVKGWQKRSQKDEIDKNGRPKCRKRFGHSIHNRCPGYFLSKAQQVFKNGYHEVPCDYRASQYDHTADEYIKKKLSERMFTLADGTLVQRDLYSSFLLYNANDTFDKIDKDKCFKTFDGFYKKEQALIDEIAKSDKKIFNSGIQAV